MAHFQVTNPVFQFTNPSSAASHSVSPWLEPLGFMESENWAQWLQMGHCPQQLMLRSCGLEALSWPTISWRERQCLPKSLPTCLGEQNCISAISCNRSVSEPGHGRMPGVHLCFLDTNSTFPNSCSSGSFGASLGKAKIALYPPPPSTNVVIPANAKCCP